MRGIGAKRLRGGLAVLLLCCAAAAGAQTQPSAAPPASTSPAAPTPAPNAAETAAVTPGGAAPPPSRAFADLENSANFIAVAFPDIHFLNETSRMAIAHASNEKVRDFALNVAREETGAGISLMHWVHTSGRAQGTQAEAANDPGLAVRVKAPRLQASQASVLQRLSNLNGPEFDALYVSIERDGLQRLTAAYQDFVQKDAGDPSLRAIAARELPEVKRLLIAAAAL